MYHRSFQTDFFEIFLCICHRSIANTLMVMGTAKWIGRESIQAKETVSII